jgi:PAS domain-containing protein
MNTRHIDGLLLDLYACTSDRSRWPHVLDQICHATGARSAVLQFLESDGECAWSRRAWRDSASEAARMEHEKYMGDDVNPRLRFARQRVLSPSQHVFRDRDFFVPGDPALAETKDRVAAIHLGHFISVSTLLSGHERLALVLHRDLSVRRDFGPDEEAFALGLIPHFMQTIRLLERIEDTQRDAQDLREAIDCVRCALVLCEPDGAVCWANRSARDMFAHGSRIHVSGDRVATSSHEETLSLYRRIEQFAKGGAYDQFAERYLVLGRGSGTALQVAMYAVSGETASSLCGRVPTRRILLVLSSPDQVPTFPADLIAHVFALSPAESRVAAALCGGLTINEYAKAAGVTIGTARCQLKQVLVKTQASRQADLVRQICSSVIGQALTDNRG